jgi:predicted dehydrogenase
MSKRLRLGILGAGHLGKIHINCALTGQNWEVVGIYDADPEQAKKASEKFGVPAFQRLSDLLEVCDAVDIVTPTTTHYQLAKLALKAGKHVFIEKPVTHTVAEARNLLKLANQLHLKVQVGHVERFNPAFLGIKSLPLEPMFIEAHRLAAFQPRGTDVSVVLDLMIHDLDLILHLVKSPVKRVSAGGVAVLSHTPDIANARIEFENGCVANLTASRISLKQMRKMRLFQQDTYISLDFLEKQAQTIRLFATDAEQLPPIDQLMEFDTAEGKKWLQLQMPETAAVNAIQEELEAFARSILEDAAPVVTLQDGYDALRLAHRILKEIDLRLQQQTR